MGKPLKIVLGVVAAVVLLLVFAVAGFAMFFDPNDFRGRITSEVKQATGRELTLGNISMSFYPALGARINDAKLGNAAGFGDTPFAVIEDADVGVQLMPLLLRREVRVGTVTISGLQLEARKNADGSSNWDDLLKGKEKDKDKAAAPDVAPADAGSGDGGIKSIDIGGVDIKSAAIHYVDDEQKTSYQFDKLDLKTGAIHPGKPFDFALNFATTVAKPAVNANVSLAATLALDLEKQSFVADKIKLHVKAATPDMKADVELAGNVTADLGSKVYKAEKIVASGSVSGGPLKDRTEKADFDGDAIYDGGKGTLKLASGELKAAGLVASIAIDGSGLNTDAPRFTGPLSIKPFNPRDLLSLLDKKIETADPAVLKEMSIKGRLDATPNSVRLADLVIKLDQSTISGSAGLADLSSKAVEFALKIDSIDVDRYRSQKQAVTAVPRTPTEKTAADNSELPFDAIDKLNASGTIDIGKLHLSGMNMASAHFAIAGPTGSAKRVDLAANLYGGSMTSTTRITPGSRPVVAETLKLVSISAGPLLEDATGKESMTGTGNVSLDVTGSGRTVSELKRALNGDVSFNFTNGAVKGFNLGAILRKGEALLQGQHFDDNEPKETDFTEFAASGHITNGILQSDSLDAKSPLFRLDGAGKVDLVNETLDYLAKPTIVNSTSGQGGEKLTDLDGIVVPIHITGPWSSPKYSLDIKAALEQKATEKLRGKLGEKVEKQLDRKLEDGPLKDSLKHGLDKLFGHRKKDKSQDDSAPPPAPSP